MAENSITSKRRKANPLSQSSAAAEVIGSNADLLAEILVSVPVKSLIRFKSVCKLWCVLISDSHFACKHISQNPNSQISGLYFYTSTLALETQQVNSVSFGSHSSLPTLSFLERLGVKSRTRIEHSCNGLLLCSNGLIKRFIVCNPTTQRYRVLPKSGCSPSERTLWYNISAYLAFDPAKSPHYKVLLVSYYEDDHFYLIKIYYSEIRSWKQVLVDAPPVSFFRCKAFWNGAIHWLSSEGVSIRFDLDLEKFIVTPGTSNPRITFESQIRYFGECGGHLILIETQSTSCKKFRIHKMDRDECTWIVKHRVSLRPIISKFPGIVDTSETRTVGRYTFSELCVLKGENEKDCALVLAIPGRVIYYSLKCKKLKVLLELPQGVPFESMHDYAYNCAHQFIESLSPV